MIVALGAGDRHAEPCCAERADAIDDVEVEIFLGNDAAFVGGHHVAHEAAGDLVVDRRVGQQIAGNLLDGELIEWLIVVERIHDPVAPHPGRARESL